MINHILCWIVLVIIGVLNGILQVTTYGKLTKDLVAHQLSAILVILFSGIVVLFLWKRWSLKSAHQAWVVGAIWFSLIILF